MSDHAATHEVLPGDPPHIHHMDSQTAYEAAKFGMWLFLGTEILLFAVLFASFFLYRWIFIGDYRSGSEQLNVYMGGLNTLVLLISSFTAARAVDAAQAGDNKKVVKLFLFTIFCGGIFLVVKFFEYKAKFDHHLFPGQENFNEYANFLGFYFCMTGLHGLHVIIGMGIMAWVVQKARHNRFSGRYYTPVELGALYWHLVDLIWIYLFPLLYLVG